MVKAKTKTTVVTMIGGGAGRRSKGRRGMRNKYEHGDESFFKFLVKDNFVTSFQMLGA